MECHNLLQLLSRSAKCGAERLTSHSLYKTVQKLVHPLSVFRPSLNLTAPLLISNLAKASVGAALHHIKKGLLPHLRQLVSQYFNAAAQLWNFEYYRERNTLGQPTPVCGLKRAHFELLRPTVY